VPTLIHEQNAVMGRANKALAAASTAVAGGFLPENGRGANSGEDRRDTGNPVRPAVHRGGEDAVHCVRPVRMPSICWSSAAARARSSSPTRFPRRSRY
jgi:hypothetical protein